MRWILAAALGAATLAAVYATKVDKRLADLRSKSPSVRERAALELERLRAKSAEPALAKTLQDDAPSVRFAAADALGEFRDARAVPALIAALKDLDPNVRWRAAYALGQICDATAVEPLVQAMDDPNWLVREYAAWSLRRIDDPRTVDLLLPLLGDDKADFAHIVWVLQGVQADRLTDKLLALLHDEKARVVVGAVRILMKIKDPRAAKPLTELLENPNPSIRRAAVVALANVGDAGVIPAVKEMFRTEKNPTVREAAKETLSTLQRLYGLAGCWSFDNVKDGVVVDESGNENDGKITAGEIVPGKIGKGLKVDGRGGVDVGKPSSLSLANHPISVMAWVKAESDGIVFVWGGAWCGMMLYVENGVPKFGVHRTMNGPSFIAEGKTKIIGRWTHLAGVIRRKRIELYVNGKLAARARIPSPPSSTPGQGIQFGYDTGNTPTGFDKKLCGVIDEIKIFNGALDQKAIEREYKRTK